MDPDLLGLDYYGIDGVFVNVEPSGVDSKTLDYYGIDGLLVAYGSSGSSSANLSKLASYAITVPDVVYPTPVVTKFAGFAVTSSTADGPATTKWTSYAVRGSLPDSAVATKWTSYAVTGLDPASAPMSKLVAYAVRDLASGTGVDVPKFVAYGVLGAKTLTITKFVAYVVKNLGTPIVSNFVAYPSTLPNPRVADITARERRRAAPGNGAREFTAQSRDRLSTQRLAWTMAPETVEAWVTWWQNDLNEGGQWFTASWPHPRGSHAIRRRFIGQPNWIHRGNGAYDLQIDCEVRDVVATAISGGGGGGGGDGGDGGNVKHFTLEATAYALQGQNPFPVGSDMAAYWDSKQAGDPLPYTYVVVKLTNDGNQSGTATVSPIIFGKRGPTIVSQPFGAHRIGTTKISGSVTRIYHVNWAYELDLNQVNAYPNTDLTDSDYVVTALNEASNIEITMDAGAVVEAHYILWDSNLNEGEEFTDINLTPYTNTIQFQYLGLDGALVTQNLNLTIEPNGAVP